MKKHFLIIGSGSIGQRHALNFSSLGCDISCVDLRNDKSIWNHFSNDGDIKKNQSFHHSIRQPLLLCLACF